MGDRRSFAAHRSGLAAAGSALLPSACAAGFAPHRLVGAPLRAGVARRIRHIGLLETPLTQAAR
ncbi:MAG: hypothetical protein AAFN74_15425, partial [Myxococcota bacterium]